ncbi:hypothetical protein HGRIS_001064 [Hohenbuehelia grisea]|uniref:Uncharacterized protein n=1 Tax=Hohenbuehelia grisea TaxID=104357 RepID=A0ABR3JQ15_9AGAR
MTLMCIRRLGSSLKCGVVDFFHNAGTANDGETCWTLGCQQQTTPAEHWSNISSAERVSSIERLRKSPFMQPSSGRSVSIPPRHTGPGVVRLSVSSLTALVRSFRTGFCLGIALFIKNGARTRGAQKKPCSCPR